VLATREKARPARAFRRRPSIHGESENRKGPPCSTRASPRPPTIARVERNGMQFSASPAQKQLKQQVDTLHEREGDLRYRTESATGGFETLADLIYLSVSGESGSGPGNTAELVRGIAQITEVMARELRLISNEQDQLFTDGDLVPRQRGGAR